MTYAQYGLISASDYNNFVGTSPGTTVNQLNTVWAVGGSSAGYGQTALDQVAVAGSVTASNWANLVNSTALSALHQGSTISSVTAPAAGSKINFVSGISTNLTTIYTNRLNATSQGTTTSNTQTYGASWNTQLIFQHTVTFGTGDRARYFFNAGGQIAITCSHPTGSSSNVIFHNLAQDIGTVVLSAPITGTIIVSSTNYNGVTKIGGGGDAPTILTNNGYYALNTANATIFTQNACTGYYYYYGGSGRIRILVKSNGTQGSNSDAGNVITIYTIWDDVEVGSTISAGSATTAVVRPPSTSNITNTWGAVSVAGTVSGS